VILEKYIIISSDPFLPRPPSPSTFVVKPFPLPPPIAIPPFVFPPLFVPQVSIPRTPERPGAWLVPRHSCEDTQRERSPPYPRRSSDDGRVVHEICDPSWDVSVFVVPPDCPMSTPVASRERGLKDSESLDFGASAFSPSQYPAEVRGYVER